MKLFPVAGLVAAILMSVAAPNEAVADDDTITIRQGLTKPDPKIWTVKNIPVCFIYNSAQTVNNTRAFRQKLQKSVTETWARHSALTFTGFGICSSRSAKAIRVIFQQQTRARAGYDPRIKNSAWVLINPTNSRGTIVHEFGHALGFAHPQARIDTPTWCIDELGGSKADDSPYHLTEWDELSIMNYCRAQDYASGALSPLDILGLQKVYGANPNQPLGLNEANDLFGAALAIGDFNADGNPDLVSTAPHEALGQAAAAGAAFVFTGNEVGALSHGYSLTQTGAGSNEAQDRLGWRAVAGNFDGRDGDELILSAPFEKPGSDPKNRGALFVYGLDNGELKPFTAFHFPRTSNSTMLGMNAMAAGDITGDQRPELLATHFLNGGGGVQTDIFQFRKVSKSLEVFATLPGTDQPGDNGILVADVFASSPGAEIIVGYPYAAPSAGAPKGGIVRVFSYTNGRLSELQTLSQHSGAANEAGDSFGSNVAVADFDGDGTLELVVSAHMEDIRLDGTDRNNAGVIGVFQNSGTRFENPKWFTQKALDAGNPERDDQFGARLATGDFDGDGFDDVAITVSNEIVPQRTEKPGYVVVSYGSQSGLTSERTHYISQLGAGTNDDRDGFGFSLAVSDLDRDGADELLVGAVGDLGANGKRAGSVFVYRTPYRPLSTWYALDQRNRLNETGNNTN